MRKVNGSVIQNDTVGCECYNEGKKERRTRNKLLTLLTLLTLLHTQQRKGEIYLNAKDGHKIGSHETPDHP